MTIEITGYSIQDGIVSIFADDVSEENLQRLERVRDDHEKKEVEYRFNTKTKKACTWFIKWLHSQKATQGCTTYGDALKAIQGTITTMTTKAYLVRE